MFRRTGKLARLSGEGSEQSLSQGSSRSKSHSFDSSEDLSKSSSLSSPEVVSKRGESFSSLRSSGLLCDSNETDFQVRILGKLDNVLGSGGGPLDVINLIDVAQQEGELPFIAMNEETTLSITAHGIKASKTNNRYVMYRFPLHKIERIVTFEDGLVSNTMLAIKIEGTRSETYVTSKNSSSVYAYQCITKEVAQNICRRFSHVLDTALAGSFVLQHEKYRESIVGMS